ncbi:hypothetical protein R3P38DRAFT_3225221 [Favolaschia claudopus]|uniref:Uncharacterized protein n=1 Tax=Favolaschia claudopus TaxID=2862362 RepID=A0AAV9ZVJ2_9AGAR
MWIATVLPTLQFFGDLQPDLPLTRPELIRLSHASMCLSVPTLWPAHRQRPHGLYGYLGDSCISPLLSHSPFLWFWLELPPASSKSFPLLWIVWFPYEQWLQFVRRSPASSGPAPPDFPTLFRPWFILSGPFTLSVLSLELLQNSSCGFSYMWSGARPSDDFELSSDTSPEPSRSGNSSSGPADFVSARLLDYMANHMPQCQPLA